MKEEILVEPVLVGREGELEKLQKYLCSAIGGKGTSVFVSGEAGIGKTRLINQFLSSVEKNEVNLLRSWCLSDIAAPYFPFMEAFNSYFSTAPIKKETDLKAWLAGPKQARKSEKLQDLTPQGWQDLTIAAVTKGLLDISTDKTTIFFIDDLQWADSASLSLLHYIARTISSARVLLLATYRSEDLNPDADGRPHPLLEAIRLMRREDLLREINLTNLSQTNVISLAEKMVGGSIDPELAKKLTEESSGNPLFVVECLRMLSEQRSLVQDRGHWRLSIDEVGIPPKIKDIILRRLGMLKPNQRRIIDLASVIGEKFDVELVSAVLGIDSLEVLEALNAVAQSSSLVCSSGSYYEFDHARSREAIYNQLSQPLRKGYHARIAEKIEAQCKGKELPVNDLAFHYAQAGNGDKAVRYALAAGEDAIEKYSNSEAIRLFKYVLTTVEQKQEYIDARVRALEGLGDAFNAVGLVINARGIFEQLSSVAESGVVKLRALRKALSCSYWSADYVRSLELGAKAEAYAQFDRLEYARLRLQRGFVADRRGEKKRAAEDFESALKVFEEEYSLRDVAAALADISFFYMGQKKVMEQFTSALRSVTLFKELEDLRGELLARGRLDMPLKELELIQQSLNNLETGVRIGEKVGDYNLTSLLLWGLAVDYALMNDTKTALAQSLKAVEYAERTNAYMTLNFCYSYLVRAYARMGEMERAEEYQKKQQMLDEKIARSSANKDPVSGVGKAFILLAKGQLKEANEIFEKMIKAMDGGWGSHREISIRDDYAWALQKQGRIEEAKMQLQIVEQMKKRLSENAKRIGHANVIPYFMAKREIGIGEELSIRLDLVNFAQNAAKLVSVEGLIPEEFKVSAMPSFCSIQDGSIKVDGKRIESFSDEPVEFAFQATKPGVFTLAPQVVYVDEVGQKRTSEPKPVTVSVRPTLHVKIGDEPITVPILPGRVTTGFAELDTLTFGGIPEKYAVMLASPSFDEREQLITKFLKAGIKSGEITFFVTTEMIKAKSFLEEYPSTFFLFICNPQADAMVQDLPNVFKLKGVENLTEIDIALTKALRTLNLSDYHPRRVCINIISDALLQHHAVNTRRWLSALLPMLKLKGFTELAVIDPQMHPLEDLQAILGLFDGEIRITEKETAKGAEKVLKIRKLRDKKYLENELFLTRENLR